MMGVDGSVWSPPRVGSWRTRVFEPATFHLAFSPLSHSVDLEVPNEVVTCAGRPPGVAYTRTGQVLLGPRTQVTSPMASRSLSYFPIGSKPL